MGWDGGETVFMIVTKGIRQGDCFFLGSRWKISAFVVGVSWKIAGPKTEESDRDGIRHDWDILGLV